eukprot:CAMPEP_0172439292 /NCGR_PEP_ID=MMETSP1065-20121228/332_1 /TAXON_ID=265537 /ORGANISM="Amphiprora paludosa, Strain CCMP125" /LENGTH=544 /DNA_ID=CAMNT_0013187957 /DNA_START=37 /DNA_END=1671 /DNA_ORIENTATION=-
MPPRAPSNPDLQVTEESEEQTTMAPKVEQKDAKTMLQPATVKSMYNTFHWELNFYCAVSLAVIYYLTPSEQRIFLHVFFALLSVDAARYYYRRGSMAGVPYTIPFVNLIAMIINPERFWAEMGAISMASKEGLCAQTMVCCQTVFCTDPKLCRQVMTGEETYGLYAHPNAIWLFDPKNLIYLEGDVHKKVRAVLTPALFSEEALLQYANAQEKVCREALAKHAAECERTGKSFDAMVAFRALGARSSQEAFMGPYLTEDMKAELEEDIMTFTMGFLSFPFPYAGGLKKALGAKMRIEKDVIKLVPKAREYIMAGNEPRCLLEHWCVAILEAAKERGCKPTEVHGCTDDDVSRCVLDFLFAAQDATNSGLVYTLDLMQAYSDVFEKCHDEVTKHCGAHGTVAEKVRTSLPYTCKVANQILHHKPPVPMVPHLCRKDNYLDGHFIPKGTVVIPSITYMARSSGHALEFLPDRPDQDSQFVKTVVFGAGQHKCPGRRYAESLLSVFLSVFAQEYQVERVGPRSGPDDFIFFPTLFPRDSNFIVKARA